MHTHAHTHIEVTARSEDTLVCSVLSFHHVGWQAELRPSSLMTSPFTDVSHLVGLGEIFKKNTVYEVVGFLWAFGPCSPHHPFRA